jgi:hypothetical protein
MTKKPKPSLHNLRRSLLLAATVQLFSENKKVHKKVSAELWTLNSKYRARNHQRAAEIWADMTGQVPELFPFTEDTVANVYMNLRKNPERQKKLHKKLNSGKSLKVAYDPLYDPLMMARAVLHVFMQNDNDSPISGTGASSDDWTMMQSFRTDLYRRVKEAWVVETKSKIFIDYFPWNEDVVVLTYVRIRKNGSAQLTTWEKELKGAAL